MAFGDIVANITVDKRQAEQGIKQFQGMLRGLQADSEQTSGIVLRRLGSSTQQASSRLSALSNPRVQRGLLELSRGAEDAAVSFGTGGLAGALRGAGNNLSQFATGISPMAGAVTGVGVAIGSVLLPRLVEMASASGDATKRLEDLKKAWSEIDVLETRIGQRKQDKGGFQSLEQATEGKATSEFDLETARQNVALAEKKLQASLSGFAPFGNELLDRVHSRDPALGGSAFLELEGQLKNQPSSFVTEGATSLDEGTRSAILDAERALQKARLDLEAARGENTANASRLEETKKRDDFAKQVLNPGVGSIGEAASQFWQGMQDAAKNSKDAKKLRETLVKETAPKDELISASLEQRTKEINKLFPQGGGDELLGLARTSALQDAQEQRSRLGTRRTYQQASLVTRGNAADFIAQQRATLQKADDPAVQAQVENNKQNEEMIKRLDKMIEELKSQTKKPPLKSAGIA